MTIDELREILHSLKLDTDARPQLIYVFYETGDGLVNNFSISLRATRHTRRQAMSDPQLAALAQRCQPDSRGGRLLAVERPDTLSRWIDAAEVCQRLHTSRQTLFRWVRRGLLHPARMGNRNYFDVDEIDALLRSNTIQDNGRLDRTSLLHNDDTP